MSVVRAEFGRMRSFFWPIYSTELRQYIPIFLMTLFLSFNYHILRNLKYGLLVLAPSAGAEAIPFVQLWGLVPGAFLMTWVLAKLCRKLSQDKIFYLMTAGFLVFFGVFQFVLYPLREILEPTAVVEWLEVHLPSSMSGFIAIIRHWVISFFYVAAELWKVSIVAVIFWGYLNTHLSLDKASRFYGPLMVATSMAGIIGGYLTSWLPKAEWVQQIGIGEGSWERTLSVMMVIVIVVGAVAMILFRYLHRHDLGESGVPKSEAKISGFSVREAFRSLIQSRYLLSLGIIVAVEYIMFGLAEILWQDQLKAYCADPGQFTMLTGRVIFWSSILSLGGGAVLSGGLIRKVGWRYTAMITPIVVLVVSLAFYLFVLFPHASCMSWVAACFGATPLTAAVFLGGVHNCLSRVAKSIFTDPTKELAFVPLDKQAQLKGKAIIDGIGMHAGRAGGALIQHLLLLGFSTVAGGAFLSFLVVVGSSFLWFNSVSYLGNHRRMLGTIHPQAV